MNLQDSPSSGELFALLLTPPLLQRQSSMRNDKLEGLSASSTWQSIYVAVVLTALQVTFFLIFFEIARRRLASVYDRRRLQFPTRTPPPLQRRWYPTWWTIKVADKEYNEQSQKEAAELQGVEVKAKDADIEILRQAEEYCRMSVPFFRDVEEEEGNEAMEGGSTYTAKTSSLMTAQTTAHEEVEVTEELEGIPTLTGNRGSNVSVWDTKQSDTGLLNGFAIGTKCSSDSEEEVWDADEVELGIMPAPTKSLSDRVVPVEEDVQKGNDKLLDAPPSPLFHPKPRLSKRRSASLPVITSSNYKEPAPMRKPSMSRRRHSLSEHDQPETLVPLVVGGSDESSRRVRFGSVDATRQDNNRSRLRLDTDVTIGSRESIRLAKLRFAEDDVKNDWDKKAIRKASKFMRTRILMLRDEEEEEETKHEDMQKKFISRQIMRRPLTVEDQEILRCIGLDAFMVLRFLKLAFDVFLWPLLLSVVSLLPLYLTGENNAIGFYGTTIIALTSHTGKYWLIVAFEYLHFCYILRHLWIEWELFMPLRYDFLEHGDFEKEKYKEQYRMTCLVEYVPASHKSDEIFLQFFDTLFPGQVKRAEVLLNTEELRRLIRERLGHITAYENVYARMVHERADYLRDLKIYEENGKVQRCCRGVVTKPREPTEPKKIVIHKIDRTDMGNILMQPQTRKVKDPRTCFAREYHHM